MFVDKFFVLAVFFLQAGIEHCLMRQHGSKTFVDIHKLIIGKLTLQPCYERFDVLH